MELFAEQRRDIRSNQENRRPSDNKIETIPDVQNADQFGATIVSPKFDNTGINLAVAPNDDMVTPNKNLIVDPEESPANGIDFDLKIDHQVTANQPDQ